MTWRLHNLEMTTILCMRQTYSSTYMGHSSWSEIITNDQSLADRLSFADAPRPFKNPRGFVSKLPYRTASTTTTTVRKTSKQISVLERERVGGGDGFLPANLTLARARGEVIEPGGKKKKVLGVGGVPNKRGYNLKNRKSLNASGVSTPATEGMESGQSTPMVDEEEEDEPDVEMADALPPGREVFTCELCTKLRWALLEAFGLRSAVGDSSALRWQVISFVALPSVLRERVILRRNAAEACFWHGANAEARPHANRTAQPTAQQEILRYHRSPRELHGSQDETPL